MTEQLFIEYFLILGILFSNVAFVRLFRNFRKIRLEEELKQIFFWFWDGTPEDRLYAWYKVRMVLKQREGEKKKIKFVDRKITGLNKRPMLGTVSVSESGALIEDEINFSIRS